MTSEEAVSVDEDEKVLDIVDTLGEKQNAWFLTEDGIYEVLITSRKPIAKQYPSRQYMTIERYSPSSASSLAFFFKEEANSQCI